MVSAHVAPRTLKSWNSPGHALLIHPHGEPVIGATLTPALLSSTSEPHTIDRLDSAEHDHPRLAELLPITPTGALRYTVAQVDRDGVVSANLASMLGWRRDDPLQLIVLPGPA